MSLPKNECKRPGRAYSLIALWTILTILFNWLTQPVTSGLFEMGVAKIWQADFLESRFLYLYLMLFTVVFPFFASFEKERVHFVAKWKYFFLGNLIVAAGFVLWDAWFTKIGVWAFNDRYLTGFRALGLPWEEWAFFVCVPFSCVFIHEVLRFSFPKNPLLFFEKAITASLLLLFFTVGILAWPFVYTSTTFLLCGFLLSAHFLFFENDARARFYLTYLVSWAPFLLVNGILTGCATREPVVLYNPGEILGLRIFTIPVEDSAYSFLLLLANLMFFEKLRPRPIGPPG